jgi:hypothetical protein
VSRFPFARGQETRRQEWLKQMNQPSFEPNKKHVLCSDHFTEDCFDRTGQTVRLRSTAVPTLFFSSPVTLDKSNLKEARLAECRSTNNCDDVVKSQSAPNLVPSRTNESLASNSDGNMSVVASRDPVLIPPSTLVQNIADGLINQRYFLSSNSLKRKAETRRVEGVKKRKLAEPRKLYLRQKVYPLREIIFALRSRGELSDNTADVVSKCFECVPLQLISHVIKNKGCVDNCLKDKCDPILRSFVLTLLFYSRKAYDFVREIFNHCLPHPSAIRQWYEDINGKPGFTSEAFDLLRRHAGQSPKKIFCSLILDEMSIRKHVEWDGEKFSGKVDMGTDLPDNEDALPEARNVLVFLVVTLQGSWKIPCAYFLIDSLSATERANLVELCISKLFDVGVHVSAVVCDGSSCNQSMFNKLGARLDADIQPSFPHPCDGDVPVFAVFDASHALKLTRNALRCVKVMIDDNDDPIEWVYIERLQQMQAGLCLRNKLHINWNKQTLSSSIANALEYCRTILELPEFAGSAATERFIRKFDRLFDVFNSQNPLGKNFHSPMRRENEKYWKPFLNSMDLYIRGLRDSSLQSILLTPCRTPFIGWLLDIYSIAGVYDTTVSQSSLHYLCTYKFSLNNLEVFFSAVRACRGFDGNPTARQFMIAFKKLLVKRNVKVVGDCPSQESVSDLYFTFHAPFAQSVDVSGLVSMYDFVEKEPNRELQSEHRSFGIPNFALLSKYVTDVVGYVAGFVVRSLLKVVQCNECKHALFETKKPVASPYPLVKIQWKNELIYASADVIVACSVAEKCSRRLTGVKNNEMAFDHRFKQALSCAILEAAGDKQLFSVLHSHMFDTEAEANHVVHLLKLIAEAFINVRVCSLNRPTFAFSAVSSTYC